MVISIVKHWIFGRRVIHERMFLNLKCFSLGFRVESNIRQRAHCSGDHCGYEWLHGALYILRCLEIYLVYSFSSCIWYSTITALIGIILIIKEHIINYHVMFYDILLMSVCPFAIFLILLRRNIHFFGMTGKAIIAWIDSV